MKMSHELVFVSDGALTLTLDPTQPKNLFGWPSILRTTAAAYIHTLNHQLRSPPSDPPVVWTACAFRNTVTILLSYGNHIVFLGMYPCRSALRVHEIRPFRCTWSYLAWSIASAAAYNCTRMSALDLHLNVTFVRLFFMVITFFLWLIVCTGGRFF